MEFFPLLSLTQAVALTTIGLEGGSSYLAAGQANTGLLAGTAFESTRNIDTDHRLTIVVSPEAGPTDGELLNMSSLFSLIDDKHIPLYRIMWISDVPHFCGHEDCLYEGKYEIRLEADESVWGSREERDQCLAQLEAWQGGASGPYDDSFGSDDSWE